MDDNMTCHSQLGDARKASAPQKNCIRFTSMRLEIITLIKVTKRRLHLNFRVLEQFLISKNQITFKKMVRGGQFQTRATKINFGPHIWITVPQEIIK